MTGRDHRPGLVARHAADITAAAERAAEGILALTALSDVDVPRAQVKVRTRGVSDPTGRAQVEVETVAERYAERLVTVTLETAETASQCGMPVVGHDVLTLADEVRGGTHGRLPWRRAIRGSAHACHEAAESVHDVWAELHRDRWVLGPGGTSVLDEGIDADLTTLVGVMRQHASDAVRLADAVSPRNHRLCACGCRRLGPPRGQGATRADCRKRTSRGQVA